MRRHQRHASMALGVALVLGIAVFAQVRHEQSSWPAPLTSLLPSSIERIDLQCGSCEQQRFERVDGVWWMRVPSDRHADSERVEHLLAIAQASVRARKPLAGLDLAKLGLQPAQATLTFNSTRVAIGGFDSINGDRYVRINDEDQVALVPDRFSPYLYAASEPANEAATQKP